MQPSLPTSQSISFIYCHRWEQNSVWWLTFYMEKTKFDISYSHNLLRKYFLWVVLVCKYECTPVLFTCFLTHFDRVCHVYCWPTQNWNGGFFFACEDLGRRSDESFPTCAFNLVFGGCCCCCFCCFLKCQEHTLCFEILSL